MKFRLGVTAILAIGIIAIPLLVSADEYVSGYYRSNGTYVNAYYRSSPDGNPYNNYSFPGNTNPYTGVTATGNPDTYLDDYYGTSGTSYTYPSDSSYTSTTYDPTSSYTSSYQVVTGGYKLYSILFCNIGYYESPDDNSCIIAPANSTAYGYSFTCNYGYTKSGNSCVKNTASYSSYSNTASAVSSVESNNASCIKTYGIYTTYNSSANNCTCDTGYYLNSTTNQCDTLTNACQALNGPYSIASGTGSCACLSGYEYNSAQKQCVSSLPTKQIKSTVKLLADYDLSDTCSQMDLSTQDVQACNFYRTNKNDYTWTTI